MPVPSRQGSLRPNFYSEYLLVKIRSIAIPPGLLLYPPVPFPLILSYPSLNRISSICAKRRITWPVVTARKRNGSNRTGGQAPPEMILLPSPRLAITPERSLSPQWPEPPRNLIPASSRTLASPGSSCAICVPGSARTLARAVLAGPDSSRRRSLLILRALSS